MYVLFAGLRAAVLWPGFWGCHVDKGKHVAGALRLRAAMICRQAKVEGKACSRAAAARACSVWTVFMMFHHGSAHVESLIAWASAVVRNTALACRNLHSSHRQQQQQWHLGGKSQSQSAAVMVCFSLRICKLRNHVPCWAFGEFSWRLRAIGRQRGGLAAWSSALVSSC